MARNDCRWITESLLLLLLWGIGAGVANAQVGPTAEALIKAWEAAQKSDPNTVVFEKTGDKTYRYETRLFAFSGTLRILSTVIDPRGDDGEYGPRNITYGMVQVELVDAPADLAQKYGMAYSVWIAGNTLFWKSPENRWMTSRELSAAIYKENSRTGFSWTQFFLEYVWLFLLVGLFLFFYVLSRRAKNQMNRAIAYQERAQASIDRSLALSERSVVCVEESNKILKEILEELKARPESTR